MVGMKGDCGGAAAVLAAFAAFVKAKPTINIHAVLCLAENAVGPKATRYPCTITKKYTFTRKKRMTGMVLFGTY